MLELFFSSSVATCRLACSEISLSIDQKKLKRGPEKVDKVQFGRWRDNFSSALYALYSDRARSSNQLQRAFYPSFNTKISNETKPELEDLSSIVNICLLWNIHELL